MKIKQKRPKLKDVLKTKPMGFQFTGIHRLYESNGRALLADDMGLGKTLQVLAWASLVPCDPALVVCPANGKFNWREEINTHTYLECEVLEGRKPHEITKPIAIINYDILPWWGYTLFDWKPKTLIVDESHYIKSMRIARTEICQKLSRTAQHVIGMSGTPIVNRPVEFFPILNMICPEEFGNFWAYAFRYCNPKRAFKGKGWNFNGAARTKELHRRVKPYMIRRMKDEVLKDLPKKRRNKLIVQCDNRKDYDKATNDFLNWYAEKAGTEKAEKASKALAMVRIGQLKKLAAEGKLKSAFEWIDDFLYDSDEKLVIWCYHKPIFQALWNRYKSKAARGKLKGEKRQEQVNKFQNDNRCRLFIGSIKADSEVITLTAASTALFLELGWTPKDHDQSEDRIRRIGQTASKLNIYYMLAQNTIDQYIWDLIEEKRIVIGRILDGKSGSTEMDVGRLVSLLNQSSKNKKRKI